MRMGQALPAFSNSFDAMANRFSSQIYVGTKGKMLNAKGVLGVVSFSLTLGSHETIMLLVEGADSQEAFTAVLIFAKRGTSSPNFKHLAFLLHA